MKIKFIKEYRSLLDDNTCRTYQVGQTWSVCITLAQWLIDNGFAEKVEKQWPVFGDQHWYVGVNGDALINRWTCDSFDDKLKAIGNVFKTKESAQRFVDYLKAVETVRRDEGFMKQSRKIDYVPCGYGLYQDHSKSIVPSTVDCSAHAGEFYFDTEEHAKASIETHRDEWRTILNYDWSKE